MSRKKDSPPPEEVPFGMEAEAGLAPQTATDEPQVANGDGATAAPKSPRNKKRDPNAPRPIFFLLAMRRDSKTFRIVGCEATRHRATKRLADAVYAIRDNEDGPFIARAKLVV